MPLLSKADRKERGRSVILFVTSGRMKFSVVIPTYNNKEELLGCLHGFSAVEGPDFEVHVCVDGSTDGTGAALENLSLNYPLKVHFHPERVNRGRSATRNLALASLLGEYTLFLDSDMIPETDFLQKHLEVLDMGNTVSIGAISYLNEAENLWARYTSERGVGKFDQGGEVPFNYFITANTAIPSSYFRETGGFDEAIRHYGGEDMELGYRIHLKYQPRFIYNPASRVATVQPKTLETALGQLYEYGATGLRYITQKHPGLRHIYWVEKCDSKALKDRFFEALTQPFYCKMAKGLLKISPYFIKKTLINYLVISHVHQGFRSSRP